MQYNSAVGLSLYLLHDCIFSVHAGSSLEVTIAQNGVPAAGQTSFSLECIVTLPHWNITSFPPTINFTGPFTTDETEERVMMVNESTYVHKLHFKALQTSHSGNYTCSANSTQLNFTASVMQELTVTSKCCSTYNNCQAIAIVFYCTTPHCYHKY